MIVFLVAGNVFISARVLQSNPLYVTSQGQPINSYTKRNWQVHEINSQHSVQKTLKDIFAPK